MTSHHESVGLGIVARRGVEEVPKIADIRPPDGVDELGDYRC